MAKSRAAQRARSGRLNVDQSSQIEKAIRRMYAQPILWNPETLQPLTDAEIQAAQEVKDTFAKLARDGLIEPCGERNGGVLWRITGLGRTFLDSLEDEPILMQ